MKNVLLILTLFISLSAISQENQGIQFVEAESFNDVLALAEKEDKLIFMDCYTTWCGPCIQLAKNVFPEKEAGDFFNEHFIPVKYDMEKGEGKTLMKKYDVKAFPTLLFLNSQGEIVFKSMGAPQNAGQLVEVGQQALDPENNYQDMIASINNATANSELNPETIAKYLKTEYPDYASYWLDKYIKALDEESLYTEHTARMIASFSNGFFDQHFQFLLNNEDKYKEQIENDQLIDDLIMNQLLNEMMKAERIKSLDHPMAKGALLKSEYISNQRTFQQNSDSLESWKKFIQAATPYLNSEYTNHMELNNAAWIVYEHYQKFNDQDAFERASKWARKSMEKEKNMYNLDTYAAFLFEQGATKKAYELQVEAVKLIEKNGDTGYIEAYKKRLKKYEKAL